MSTETSDRKIHAASDHSSMGSGKESSEDADTMRMWRVTMEDISFCPSQNPGNLKSGTNIGLTPNSQRNGRNSVLGRLFQKRTSSPRDQDSALVTFREPGQEIQRLLFSSSPLF